MTVIPTARQSKTNWMNTHLKHCSRLNNKSFDTILIGDSLIAGLTRYSKVWNKLFKPHNAFNCAIGSNRVQHVLWRAHDLRRFSSLRNVILLCYVIILLFYYEVPIIYNYLCYYSSELEVDGYDLVRLDRSRGGGGVACYIKSSIAYSYKDSLCSNTENIFVDIFLPKSKPILLGILYRPSDKSDFVKHINKVFTETGALDNKSVNSEET